MADEDDNIEYCHDTREEALAQLRAINANKQVGGEPSIRSLLESRIHHSFTVAADQLFSLGYMSREQRINLSGLISDVLTSFGDAIDTDLADLPVIHEDAQILAQTKETNMSDTTTDTQDSVNSNTDSGSDTEYIEIIHPKSVGEKAQANNKEGFYFATSFAELDAAREAQQKREHAVTIISDFMALSANAMEWEEDPVKAIESLASEMVARLRSGAAHMEETEEGSSDKQQGGVGFPDATRNGFMVWKEKDGTYRWLGVYSNKFRDNDRPVAEIISEKAHQEFIGRVNSGEIDYPVLRVWHIPVPVGKSDLLAYDDSGFSVVSGTFTNKSVAEALLVTSEDLAMSHGMPAEFIERDSHDKSIITRYVSTEVSVLPREAAANKLTTFGVVHEAKEETMAIAPELRGKVVGMIGEEATASLEEGLEDVAGKAVENNIDYKEEGKEKQQADTPADSQERESDSDDVGATKESAQEDAEAQGADAESLATDDSEASTGEASGEQDVDPILALKQEIAEIVLQVVKTVEDSNEVILQRIEALEERATTQDEEKEKEKKEATADSTATPASLAAMLASQLSGSRANSVIGNSATQVHGNSALAKDAPEENEGETHKAQGPFFFQQWTN